MEDRIQLTLRAETRRSFGIHAIEILANTDFWKWSIFIPCKYQVSFDMELDSDGSEFWRQL